MNIQLTSMPMHHPSPVEIPNFKSYSLGIFSNFLEVDKTPDKKEKILIETIRKLQQAKARGSKGQLKTKDKQKSKVSAGSRQAIIMHCD